MKKKNLAFTLAEVLIVIGIIGVVAALTLPNLNHATGDKETVTRLQKAYSILNEANDRAVAIYGPISSWKSNEQCNNDPNICWMKRIGEFLKISKYCNEFDSDSDDYISCDNLKQSGFSYDSIIYQLPDGIAIGANSFDYNCQYGPWGWNNTIQDVCSDEIYVDIDGQNKGKNKHGQDIFHLGVSDSLGVIARKDEGDLENETITCMLSSSKDSECTWWVLEYGNLDYLKADDQGYCNDNPSIKLDGVTNTSCH